MKPIFQAVLSAPRLPSRRHAINADYGKPGPRAQGLSARHSLPCFTAAVRVIRFTLLIIIAWMTSNFTVCAQDALEGSRLHIPPAEAYVQFIDAMLAEEQPTDDVLGTAIDELEQHLAQYPMDDIITAYDQLMAHDSIGYRLNHNVWMAYVVEDQIQDVGLSIDLTVPHALEDDIVIESVIQADFRSDGSPEMILQVSREWSNADRSGYRYRYEGYLTAYMDNAGVLQVTETLKGGKTIYVPVYRD